MNKNERKGKKCAACFFEFSFMRNDYFFKNQKKKEGEKDLNSTLNGNAIFLERCAGDRSPTPIAGIFREDLARTVLSARVRKQFRESRRHKTAIECIKREKEGEKRNFDKAVATANDDRCCAVAVRVILSEGNFLRSLKPGCYMYMHICMRTYVHQECKVERISECAASRIAWLTRTVPWSTVFSRQTRARRSL